MTVHQNFINGEWVGGDGAENINLPNTNEVVGVYARASAEDTKNAIAAAKAQGPGSLRMALMDTLHGLDEAAVRSGVRAG